MNPVKSHTARMEEHSCQLSLGDASWALRTPDPSKTLWVTDDQVWAAISGPSSSPELRSACAAVPKDRLVILPSGEDHKAWPAVETIINKGFSLGLARDSMLVGIGGGVVTDMTSFAASLYMRGCGLILVPTTLLAMVDAAFGGKTGINFGGFKNMVGTFYPASEVRVYPGFCTSLPEREFLGGLGEVLKSALLDDRDLWNWLKNNKKQVMARDPEALERLIWDSLMVKSRIVEQDLREKSIRAHLNLGHTFAHGLESVAGFGVWSHGEAVAWGMVKALQLSARLGLCDESWLHEVRSVIEDYGFRTRAPVLDSQALLQAMTMDKKKKGGRVHYVLQRGLCNTLTQAVEDKDVLAVLDQA